MEARGDHGKAKQEAFGDYSSQKKLCCTIDKSKGKMLDTNYFDCGIHESQTLGSIIPSLEGSIIPSFEGKSNDMTVIEQQLLQHNETPPSNVGYSYANMLMMAPPIDNYYISKLWQEENNINKQNSDADQIQDMVECTSFLELMSVGSLSRESMVRESSKYEELQSWVEKMKQSWALTGCSLILDVWVVDDIKNGTLMDVIVDSPVGSVFLKSLDVSVAVDNAEALELVIEGLIHELGAHNVLQIISSTSSKCLDIVAQRINAKYEWMFWSISATYCLSLILERLATSLTWIHDTIAKAKRITSLFMVTLLFWNSLTLRMGKIVAKLVVNDKTFWKNVTLAVKGGIPIVNFIRLINQGNFDEDRPHMGILYETMDQMKETIVDEIGMNKAHDFWVVIDEFGIKFCILRFMQLATILIQNSFLLKIFYQIQKL
ncbi:Trigger factor [Bienertia sinuspersici]